MCIFLIGAGSACVYGLLAAKKNNWDMLTSETDALNYEYAKRNIQKNALQDKVTGKFAFPLISNLEHVKKGGK